MKIVMNKPEESAIIERTTALRWRIIRHWTTDPLTGNYIPDEKVLEQAYWNRSTGEITWQPIETVEG